MTNGDFGYHTMWKNLIAYIRGLDVAAIRKQAGLSDPLPSMLLNVFLLEAEFFRRVQHEHLHPDVGRHLRAVAFETTIIRAMASGTVQMAGCSQRMRSSGCAAQKVPSEVERFSGR